MQLASGGQVEAWTLVGPAAGVGPRAGIPLTGFSAALLPSGRAWSGGSARPGAKAFRFCGSGQVRPWDVRNLGAANQSRLAFGRGPVAVATRGEGDSLPRWPGAGQGGVRQRWADREPAGSAGSQAGAWGELADKSPG